MICTLYTKCFQIYILNSSLIVNFILPFTIKKVRSIGYGLNASYSFIRNFFPKRNRTVFLSYKVQRVALMRGNSRREKTSSGVGEKGWAKSSV